MRQLLEETVDVFARGDELSRMQAGAILATAILQISYEARLLNYAEPFHASVGADAVRRVQRARELLESPLWMQSSIEDVAAHIGWSSDYLRRMCRNVLDASPHQIQNEARVRHAKALLRSREMPIAEVALRCGFDDPCYFARAFKKQAGMSPRAFVKYEMGQK